MCEVSFPIKVSGKPATGFPLMSSDSSNLKLEIGLSNCSAAEFWDSTEQDLLVDQHAKLLPRKIYLKDNGPVQTCEGYITRSYSCRSFPSKAKELLNRQNMTQSMPNFQSTRPSYNRKVGFTLNRERSLKGVQRTLINRIAEFDALLESL